MKDRTRFIHSIHLLLYFLFSEKKNTKKKLFSSFSSNECLFAHITNFQAVSLIFFFFHIKNSLIWSHLRLHNVRFVHIISKFECIPSFFFNICILHVQFCLLHTWISILFARSWFLILLDACNIKQPTTWYKYVPNTKK